MKWMLFCVTLGALILAALAPDALAQEGESAAASAIVQNSNQPEHKSEAKPNNNRQLIMQEPQFGAFDERPQVPLPNPAQNGGKAIRLIGNIEEKNLVVEWNDWHNKFARAVRQRMFKSYFETINMRQGITTWYRCDVSSDKHIQNLKIVKSSGDFWYDGAVVKAVNSLDGNEILSFPPQSKRSLITTEVGIELGGERRDVLDFGDVEYRELAPGEAAQPKATEGEQFIKSGRRKHKKRSDN